MKMKRFLPVLLGLLILLCGCEKNTPVPEKPEDGGYSVYYRDAAMTTLTEKKVKCVELTPQMITDTLIDRMRNTSERSDQYISVIPETAVYNGCEQKEDVMYLKFDSFYSALSVPEQVLFRAAVTKTITQIPGIEYVSILANNQPLMDSEGNPVGFLNASDFVNVLGRDVNTVTHTDLKLYYANEEGNALVPESLSVTYTSSSSIEQFIVERLIEGPEEEGCYRSVPSDTKVLSVTTKDNICYLNLDGSFTNSKSDVSAGVTIWSIVNSLTELSHVKSVQITVEGVADISFRNEISLAAPLSRNLDYIEVKE